MTVCLIVNANIKLFSFMMQKLNACRYRKHLSSFWSQISCRSWVCIPWLNDSYTHLFTNSSFLHQLPYVSKEQTRLLISINQHWHLIFCPKEVNNSVGISIKTDPFCCILNRICILRPFSTLMHIFCSTVFIHI